MIELYEAGKPSDDDSIMGMKDDTKTFFNVPTEDDIEWAKTLADEIQK